MYWEPLAVRNATLTKGMNHGLMHPPMIVGGQAAYSGATDTPAGLLSQHCERRGKTESRATSPTVLRTQTAIIVAVPIKIFDSDTIPRDRRAELEAAVVTAGKRSLCLG